MIPFFGILRVGLSFLRNPLVLMALGLAAMQGYGVYKSHQGAKRAEADCNAHWEANLAAAHEAESARLRKALRAALERQKDADKRMAELRAVAAKLKEGFSDAKDCNLDPAVIDRLRRIK